MVILSLLIVFVNYGFFVQWLQQRKDILSWDNANYYKQAISLSQQGLNGIYNNVLNSTLHSDYSSILAVPIALFMKFFGLSRMLYETVIYWLYMVPAAVFGSTFFTRVLKIKKDKINRCFPALLFLLLFLPSSAISVLSFRVDIAPLALVALIGIYLSFIDLQKFNWRDSFILGLLFLILILLRRWYLYFVISFFLVYWSGFVLKAVIDNKNIKLIFKQLRGITINLFISGITMLGIMATVIAPQFKHTFLVNYTDLYSSYNVGSWGERLTRFVLHFGLLFVIISIIGYVIAIKSQKNKITNLFTFTFVQGVLIFIMFNMTQTFGEHHYYLLVPFVITGLVGLLVYSTKNIAKIGLLVITLVIFIMSHFFLPVNVLQKPITPLILGNSVTFAPPVRHDIKKIQDLNLYLGKHLAKNGGVYVLSSTGFFNGDGLNNVFLPQPSKTLIYQPHDVDKRDGFSPDFFKAQYIIVADPIQLHQGPDNQLLIDLPAEAILAGKVTNLELVKQVSIDNGVKLNVYKRVGKYSYAFFEELKDKISKRYPGYTNIQPIFNSEYVEQKGE